MAKGWLSPWSIWDTDRKEFIFQDDNTPSWTFPNEDGNVLLSASEADIDGDIAASVDHSSGIILNNRVYNDYGTLVSGQEYKAGYYRYNVRSTTPGNPTAEVTGLEGVAASYIADEALTFRGGYFRTYINADAVSTMRTSIGCEISSRASYSGGTECVAEAGTAFVGGRIWMAPYFTAGSVGNINNFWGLWVYGEHNSQRNADAAIYISDAGGGFTDIIRFTAAGGADTDVTFVKLLVTGSPTIIWDESEDKWSFNKGIAFTSAGGIKFGSYASPVDLGSATTIGFSQWWGSGSGSDTFIIGQQLFVKTTESARPFPLCVQAEINNDGATYPDRGQAAQFIILLGGGGEASKLGALGGDATAGMYATWHKVGANVSCSTESGCRVAPIWLDNQMNCVVNGEEYAAFITCGGSKVDAVFGFETTSSGWTALFSFDETAYNKDPVVASGCNVSGAGASEPYLRVLLNETEYGIPLIAI